MSYDGVAGNVEPHAFTEIIVSVDEGEIPILIETPHVAGPQLSAVYYGSGGRLLLLKLLHITCGLHAKVAPFFTGG